VKRIILSTILCLAVISGTGRAQTNQPSRPISGAITNVVLQLTTSTTTPPGLSAAFGQFVNAAYLYVATNNTVSAGLGNTIAQLGKGKLVAVTSESVDLPDFMPTNGVLSAKGEIVTTQLLAPDKTHLGLGIGLNTLWHVGWLQKLHFGPLQNLQGISLALAVAPDIDKTANLKFGEKDTVAVAKAGLQFTF